jgi:chromosome segregation ATPase
MARPGVTYSEIATAASHLVGQGKNPTIEQIRLFLGTGSSTTIANHLKEWKERQQGASLLAAKENIPAELMEMVKGIWERVIGLSQEKMDDVEADFKKQLETATAEIQKYKVNNHKWQKLFTQWQIDKEKSDIEVSELKANLAALQQDNANLKSKLLTEEARVKEKQSRIDELHRLHQQVQMNLEHYRESVRVQRLADTERHIKEIQAISDELKATKNTLTTTMQDKLLLQQQVDKQKMDFADLRKKADNIQLQNQTLQHENSTLDKQCETSHLTVKHLQQQNVTLQRQIEQQARELIDEKAKGEELKLELGRLRKKREADAMLPS